MAWPSFDVGEAINQAISATATVGGVVLGGWLAFRLGIRQLRRERALDRRVEWHEKLIAAVAEYRTSASVFLQKLEEALNAPDANRDLRYRALAETTDRGREVQNFISRADLYGTTAEQLAAKNLYVIQLDMYVTTWGAYVNGHDAVAREKIGALLKALETERVRLTESLRAELDIEAERPGRIRRQFNKWQNRKLLAQIKADSEAK